MSDRRQPIRQRAQPYTKYLDLYLILTVGSVWLLALSYAILGDTAVDLLGELDLRNPAVILVLHSPAIAAFLIFYLYDGSRGIKNFFRTLVPRKADLPWLPVLAALMLAYIFVVRYLCIAFGIDVPDDPESPWEMLLTFLELFYKEVGMVAITIGWFGFYLPLFHRITNSHVWSGIATGFGIGMFVAPGNLFASFELATAWPIYVSQLSILGIGMSLLLSRMKGNVLFFLIPFWVSASGSAMRLYYFERPTQLVQISLFSIFVVALYFYLKREGNGELENEPHLWPEYFENEYTTRKNAPIPGEGDRSKTFEIHEKAVSESS